MSLSDKLVWGSNDSYLQAKDVREAVKELKIKLEDSRVDYWIDKVFGEKLI